ncbi:MAG: sigma-70 family RNA polymerase sigma factor [Rhizobiales bacterium]|nr:sigma-70 family RNA polymerase sigma factor [Hyphomicrobiales bacterium]MBI3674553.1 sigma-70 family RNA polymerase sigma factor [Hyphomicrobiales bacterium]
MAGQAGSTEVPAADFRSADDAVLLSAAARGDAGALVELARRHYQPVYRLAWRLTGGHADSEDIAQEAFLKLWQNPQQVRDAGALKGWLMRVASNAVIDRARRRPLADIGEVPEVADGRERPDETLDRTEAAGEIDRRIAALPERQKLALTLVHFEDLTNIEAAVVMEVSIEAVESLLARARRSLRQSLSADWQDLLEGLNARGA